MAEARGFRNRSRCRVEEKLKADKLTARKIEKERVTVVDLGINERLTHACMHGSQDNPYASTDIRQSDTI